MRDPLPRARRLGVSSETREIKGIASIRSPEVHLFASISDRGSKARQVFAGSYGFFSMLFLDNFNTILLGKRGMTHPKTKFNEGSLIFSRSPFNIAS